MSQFLLILHISSDAKIAGHAPVANFTSTCSLSHVVIMENRAVTVRIENEPI